MQVDYDPFTTQDIADPFPAYQMLRDHAPVHWAEPSGSWVISRFDDVQYVLRHAELFSSDAMLTFLAGGNPRASGAIDPEMAKRLAAFASTMPFPPQDLMTAANLIALDPPRHTGVRNVVNRGFTPRRIAAWEDRARELVAECMARVRGAGSFDVVRDLAVPLPVTLIAELLGVESDRMDDFKHWSNVTVSFSTGSMRRQDPFVSGVLETMRSMFEYIQEAVDRRRREPGEDLISVVVRAQDGEAGLTAVEVAMLVQLLLVAGNETTTNLLGNTTDVLLRNPEQLERVRRDKSLVPALVEEALRYCGPVQFVARRATRDVELSGTRIRANDPVLVLIGSANRDERQWGADADRFDVGRNTSGHLAFGFGVHFCLGASLARLEARCALEALVDELPRLARAKEEVEYMDSFLIRGPRRLELVRAA